MECQGVALGDWGALELPLCPLHAGCVTKVSDDGHELVLLDGVLARHPEDGLVEGVGVS